MTDHDAKARDYLKGIGQGAALESTELVPETAGTEAQRDHARSAVAKLGRREPLAPIERFALEAIVIPDKRPAVLIENGTYTVSHPLWLDLNDALAPSVARAVADMSAGCGGPEISGAEEAIRSWSILQMNYARPSEAADEFINDEHEDGCLLTAMVGTGRGLELKRNDGSFEAVEPSPGRVVLASGEILWLLTGGAIQPTYHRVRRIAGMRERISLLLFADLSPALCAPWIANGVNHGVDIADRVLKNATRYGLKEWAAP